MLKKIAYVHIWLDWAGRWGGGGLGWNISKRRVCDVVLFNREEKMQSHKQIKSHSRLSSSTAHFSPSPKVPYRTILKRRNDTISSSQLYEDASPQKTQTHSKILSQSQIRTEDNRGSFKSPPLDIKEYAKKLGNKPQQKPPRRDSLRRQSDEEDGLTRRSLKPKGFATDLGRSVVMLEKKEKTSMEGIEKRLQDLMALHLVRFKKQRSHVGLAKWSEIKNEQPVEKELEEIIEDFNSLRLLEEGETDKLEDLNRKIEVLERMIAGESTESEVLKSQYFGWKNQRTNTTSFVNKKMLSSVGRLNGDGQVLNRNKEFLSEEKKSKESVVKYASTSKLYFKQPAKEFYLNMKQKRGSFVANRQPMPRSSYSAQYLNYGYMPTYAYKPDETKQFPQTSLAIKASTYQQEYRDKLGMTKNIDFKELDCFRDKFKNTNISFMNSCKKKYVDRCSENLKKKGKEKSKENLSESLTLKGPSHETNFNLMSLSTCGDFYKSENHKQFIWHNSLDSQESQVIDSLLKSEIKDKRLSKLKDAFKAMAMRS